MLPAGPITLYSALLVVNRFSRSGVDAGAKERRQAADFLARLPGESGRNALERKW